MKKNVKKALLVLAGALVLVGAGILSACQTNYGEIKDKEVAIGEYTEINVSNGIDIVMSATVTKPVLTADELIHDKVVIKVEGNTLFVELKDIIYNTNIKELKLYLPLNPELRKITSSGACLVKVEGPVKLEEVKLSGASSLDVNNTTNMKKIVMSGASKADISGVGDKVELEISGASDLDAVNLLVSEMSGTLSGASAVDVTVCTKIAIKASGVSLINFGLVSPTCEVVNECELTGGSKISQR